MAPNNISCTGVNVKAFGAVGDGVTDDRAAIQAAIDFASPLGNTVCFPPGNYKIDTCGGALRVDNVGMCGPAVVNGYVPPGYRGATILVYGDAQPALRVGRKVQLRDLAFFYPEQRDTSAPLPFPPTVDFDFSVSPSIQFVYIDRCAFVNSFQAINIDDDDGSVGHVWITNCGIYGIDVGLRIRMNVELIHVLNNHFTFGFTFGIAEGIATEAGLRKYTRTKGRAIVYESGDGIDIRGNLFFGYNRGIYIPGRITATGDRRGVILSSFSSNRFDQVLFGISTDRFGWVAGVTIVDNSFLAFDSTSPSSSGIGIYLNGNADKDGPFGDVISITGNYFGQSTLAHIAVDNRSGGSVQISGNTFAGVGFRTPQPPPVPATLSLNCSEKDITFTGNKVTRDVDTSVGVKAYSAHSVLVTGNHFSNFQYIVQAVDLGTASNLVVANMMV